MSDYLSRALLPFLSDLGRMDITREVIDDRLNAQKHKAAYDNPTYASIPPPWMRSRKLQPSTLLPPESVQNKAGRPKGEPTRKDITVIGDHSTYLKFNERTSAPTRAVGDRLVEPESTGAPFLPQPTLYQQTSAYVTGVGTKTCSASEFTLQ